MMLPDHFHQFANLSSKIWRGKISEQAIFVLKTVGGSMANKS